MLSLSAFATRSTVESDGVQYHDLMKHYDLEAPYAKLAGTKLPTTYHHLLRGVGDKATAKVEAAAPGGSLLSLLQGVPFDRPIETLPDATLKSALQLPPASKLGPVLHPLKDRTSEVVNAGLGWWLTRARSSDGPDKSQGLIHAPPPTHKEKLALDEKLKGKAKDDHDRKEKKDKKKKKREREDASVLQSLLAPLVTELRGLTWAGWIVSGKAGNPFIQVGNHQQSVDWSAEAHGIMLW